MNKIETTAVLAMLKAVYPTFYKDMSELEIKMAIDMWQKIFANDKASDVQRALEMLISTRTVGYPPVPGELKEQMAKFSAPDVLSEQQAWALVEKATRNGSYGFKKEFDKLPPIVQRVVGRPEQIRAWAGLDAEEVQTVVASNFMRSYRAEAEKERENQKLSQPLRDMIERKNERLLSDGSQ